MTTFEATQAARKAEFGESMPISPMKLLFAFLMPSDPPRILALSLSSLAMSAWTIFLGMPPMVQILAIAMLADFLTGWYAAELHGEWNKSRAIRGIAKKGLMAILSLLVFSVVQIAGSGDLIFVVLMTALCITEGKSILVNLRRGEIEIDLVFDAVLSRFGAANAARLGPATQNQSKTEKPEERGNG